jgi:hypothetical protein
MWQENNAILATSNNNQSDGLSIYFYRPPCGGEKIFMIKFEKFEFNATNAPVA